MKVEKYICYKCGNNKFNIYNPDETGYTSDLIFVCTKCNTDHNTYNEETIKNFENKNIEICKKCYHEICPHCGDWCDTMLYSKDDIGNHCDVDDEDDEDDYPTMCCGGSCTL